MALRGDLHLDAAIRRAAALQYVRMTLEPMQRLLPIAVEMAIRLGHPAYDCFYLALASSDDCPFATADRKLIQKLRAARFGEAEVLSLADAAALTG